MTVNEARGEVREPEGMKRQREWANVMRGSCSGYRFSGLRGREESQELNVFINWCYCQGPKRRNKLKSGEDEFCPLSLFLSCLKKKKTEDKNFYQPHRGTSHLKLNKTNLWCQRDKKQQIKERWEEEEEVQKFFFCVQETTCTVKVQIFIQLWFDLILCCFILQILLGHSEPAQQPLNNSHCSLWNTRKRLRSVARQYWVPCQITKTRWKSISSYFFPHNMKWRCIDFLEGKAESTNSSQQRVGRGNSSSGGTLH